MKRLLVFPAAAILFFGVIQTFAQTVDVKKEAIIVKLSVPNMETQVIDLPIDANLSEGKDSTGGSTSACGGCSNEYARLLADSAYEYLAKAVRKTDTRAQVKFRLTTGKGCKVEKLINVSRRKNTRVKLGCGAKAEFYYGYVSEDKKPAQ